MKVNVIFITITKLFAPITNTNKGQQLHKIQNLTLIYTYPCL